MLHPLEALQVTQSCPLPSREMLPVSVQSHHSAKLTTSGRGAGACFAQHLRWCKSTTLRPQNLGTSFCWEKHPAMVKAVWSQHDQCYTWQYHLPVSTCWERCSTSTAWQPLHLLALDIPTQDPTLLNLGLGRQAKHGQTTRCWWLGSGLGKAFFVVQACDETMSQCYVFWSRAK